MSKAQDLLLYQWQKSKKINGLVISFAKSIQEIFDMVQTLKNGQFITQAFGERLDVLGTMVGQPRNSMPDEEYALWIKVKIRLNLNCGTLPEMLDILFILLGNTEVVIKEYYPNNIIIIFLKNHINKAIQNILKSACPLGSNLHLQKANLTNLFCFDVTKQFDGMLCDYFEE